MKDYPETCWKPPETVRGGFRQVSGFFHYRNYFFSKMFINKNFRKPSEAGFRNLAVDSKLYFISPPTIINYYN